MSEGSPDYTSEPGSSKGFGEQAAEAVKREGRQFAGEVGSASRELAREQKDALADYVAALASAGSAAADDLEASGYGRSAATVSRTADDVADLAQRLQDRELGELWQDLEDFAREHPVLTFAAGFAAAFGVTRLLKSSAEIDEEPPGGSPEDAAGRD